MTSFEELQMNLNYYNANSPEEYRMDFNSAENYQKYADALFDTSLSYEQLSNIRSNYFLRSSN